MSKKVLAKGQIAAIIVASVLVVILSLSIGLYFGVFKQEEYYEIDLNKIRNQKPTFSDEFDGNSLNLSNWRVDVNGNHPRRGGWWKESQVVVEDGNLKLRTEKVGDDWYTGAVTSVYEQEFGYFEARMKLPKGYGIWSAFWMMNDKFGSEGNISGKDGGAEIDIVEAPCWPRNMIQQSVHKGGYGKNTKQITHPSWLVQKYDDLYDTYNTYSVFWNEEIYVFYFNDVAVWTTSFNDDTARGKHYMYLSVEIGGEDGKPTMNNWWAVGGKLITEKGNEVNFPSDMAIDYVKAWDVSSYKYNLEPETKAQGYRSIR